MGNWVIFTNIITTVTSTVAAFASVLSVYYIIKKDNIKKKSFKEHLFIEIEYNIDVLRRIESDIHIEKHSRYGDQDKIKEKRKSRKFIINVWYQLNKYYPEVLKTEENKILFDFYADLEKLNKEEYWEDINLFNDFVVESDIINLRKKGEYILNILKGNSEKP